jgi:hypothetical protein
MDTKPIRNKGGRQPGAGRPRIGTRICVTIPEPVLERIARRWPDVPLSERVRRAILEWDSRS